MFDLDVAVFLLYVFFYLHVYATDVLFCFEFELLGAQLCSIIRRDQTGLCFMRLFL